MNMQLKAFFNFQDSLFVGKQTHILMLTIKQDMYILKELIFITSRQILISKPLKLTLSTSLEIHRIYNSLGLILHIYSLEPSLSRYFHSYLIGDKSHSLMSLEAVTMVRAGHQRALRIGFLSCLCSLHCIYLVPSSAFIPVFCLSYQTSSA